MTLKKVLTGSALSLALLVSAAPAFAASPTNHSTNHESVSPQAVLQDYYLGAKSRAELKNAIPVFGTNFYLKPSGRKGYARRMLLSQCRPIQLLERFPQCPRTIQYLSSRHPIKFGSTEIVKKKSPTHAPTSQIFVLSRLAIMV